MSFSNNKMSASSSNLRFASTHHENEGVGAPYGCSYIPDRVPRRRKRPGNRTRERKPLGRYDDYSDSISIALDTNFKLPHQDRPGHLPHPTTGVPGGTVRVVGVDRPPNRSNPSPLLRKSFDQSWLRWKDKEMIRERQEKEAQMLREKENARIFGGDLGDDGSLCLKMLDVVRFLFGGDIDFGY